MLPVKLTVLIAGMFLSLVCGGQIINSSSATSLYVYNNGKDTIRLLPPGEIPYSICISDSVQLVMKKTKRVLGRPVFWQCGRVRIIDSVQVDGKGAKELIFSRQLSGRHSNHGGSFDIIEEYEMEKIEIWNTDTKELYWQAVTNCSCAFSRFEAYAGMMSITGTESFAFTFRIDKDGTVYLTKKDTKVKLKWKDNITEADPPYQLCPATTEGTWRFTDGRYIKEGIN